MGRIILSSKAVYTNEGLQLYKKAFEKIRQINSVLYVDGNDSCTISAAIVNAFLKLGVTNVYSPDNLKGEGIMVDAIYLNEGNVFCLAKKIQEVKEYIIQLYKNGALIMGASAGAMIIGADIKNSDVIFGEKNMTKEDYNGLGLMDALVLPHMTWKEKETLLSTLPNLLVTNNAVLNVNDEEIVLVINGAIKRMRLKEVI